MSQKLRIIRDREVLMILDCWGVMMMGPFFESGSEASVIVRFPSGINNDNVQRGCKQCIEQ